MVYLLEEGKTSKISIMWKKIQLFLENLLTTGERRLFLRPGSDAGILAQILHPIPLDFWFPFILTLWNFLPQI